MAESVVVDASALVDLLVDERLAPAVGARLAGQDLHAPAHLDVEVLSALGRLQRDSRLTAQQVGERLDLVAGAAIDRHLLGPLLDGAWRRRARLRLADAVYVELAEQLGATLVTTDARLAKAGGSVELVTA